MIPHYRKYVVDHKQLYGRGHNNCPSTKRHVTNQPRFFNDFVFEDHFRGK